MVVEGLGDEGSDPPLILSFNQVIDQSSRVVEAYPAHLPCGRNSQGGGDVGLPQTGVTDQDDRFRLVDVITGCQLPDFLLVQCGNLAEVKAVQLFNNRYLGLLEPPLPAASISLQDLLLGQSEEEAGVALVALGGFRGVRLMMADKGRQVQLL